ncbi:MAG TPA: radical SAM protein [Acidimicrobiia bacterium]
MARIVLTDAYVKLNNVDLSDHIASVEIAQSFDSIETTAFGDSGRTRVGGLEDSSVTLSFHQDFAAASVDQTIAPLVGGTAAFEIRAVGTATAVSSTNPKWTGTVLITEWNPLSGAVGELSTADVTWPVSGQVTRGTA